MPRLLSWFHGLADSLQSFLTPKSTASACPISWEASAGSPVPNTQSSRRHPAWFPTGRALSIYEKWLKLDVEAVLKNSGVLPIEGYPLVTLSLYLEGPSREKAWPVVVICCIDKQIREKGEAAVRRSGKLVGGFEISSAESALELVMGGGEHHPTPRTSPSQAAADTSSDDDDDDVNDREFSKQLSDAKQAGALRLSDARYRSVKPSQQSRQHQDRVWSKLPKSERRDLPKSRDDLDLMLVGRRLIASTKSDRDGHVDRPATGGPVLYVGSFPFQMCAGHILWDKGQENTPEGPGTPNDSPDQRMLSARPAYIRRFQPERGSEPHDTIMEVSRLGEQPPDSAAPVYLGEAGSRPGLDYGLVALDSTSYIHCGNPFRACNSGAAGGHQSISTITDVAPIPKSERQVVVITASKGTVRGRLEPGSTSWWVQGAGNGSFQDIYTVVLEDGAVVNKGDSGSAVVDRKTGHFYGHVVLGSPGTALAYIVPAINVFQHIRETTSLPVSLNPPILKLEGPSRWLILWVAIASPIFLPTMIFAWPSGADSKPSLQFYITLGLTLGVAVTAMHLFTRHHQDHKDTPITFLKVILRPILLVAVGHFRAASVTGSYDIPHLGLNCTELATATSLCFMILAMARQSRYLRSRPLVVALEFAFLIVIGVATMVDLVAQHGDLYPREAGKQICIGTCERQASGPSSFALTRPHWWLLPVLGSVLLVAYLGRKMGKVVPENIRLLRESIGKFILSKELLKLGGGLALLMLPITFITPTNLRVSPPEPCVPPQAPCFTGNCFSIALGTSQPQAVVLTQSKRPPALSALLDGDPVFDHWEVDPLDESEERQLERGYLRLTPPRARLSGTTPPARLSGVELSCQRINMREDKEGESQQHCPEQSRGTGEWFLDPCSPGVDCSVGSPEPKPTTATYSARVGPLLTAYAAGRGIHKLAQWLYSLHPFPGLTAAPAFGNWLRKDRLNGWSTHFWVLLFDCFVTSYLFAPVLLPGLTVTVSRPEDLRARPWSMAGGFLLGSGLLRVVPSPKPPSLSSRWLPGWVNAVFGRLCQVASRVPWRLLLVVLALVLPALEWKHGTPAPPSLTPAQIGGIIGGVFALLWIIVCAVVFILLTRTRPTKAKPTYAGPTGTISTDQQYFAPSVTIASRKQKHSGRRGKR